MRVWLAIGLCCLAGGAWADDLDHERTLARERLQAAQAELAEAAREFAALQHEIARSGDPVSHSNGRPSLGIFIRNADQSGIEVAAVVPRGGAEEAGLRGGDVLVRIENVDLSHRSDPMGLLHEVLDELEPGDAARVEVKRGQESIIADVATAASRLGGPQHFPAGVAQNQALLNPDVRLPFAARALPVSHGLQLIDIQPTLGDYFGVEAGVLVVSASEATGLRAGDVILALDGTDVRFAHEAYRALGLASEGIELSIVRRHRRQSIHIDPAEGGLGPRFLGFESLGD